MTDVRRILCIDGGGIKGVVPAAFLACLEQASGKTIREYFDLIAGTSTGGIIAIGLGLGQTAADILGFYEKRGPAIFNQRAGERSLFRRLRGLVSHAVSLYRPRYKPEALRDALHAVLGDALLGESHNRLLIPAFDRQRGRVHIFKTAHHERLANDWRERAVDVALATAAAPIYLPSHRLASGISLVDGGVWANNPTGMAVVEATAILGWEPKTLRVLSLGCTDTPLSWSERAGYEAAFDAQDLFLAGQSWGAMGTAKLLMGADAEQRLLRFQHTAHRGEFALEGTHRISDLRGIGAAMAREALPRVSQLFLSQPCEQFVPLQGRPTPHTGVST